MKTKVVELKFNIIVEVSDDSTNDEIVEEARQELNEILCTQGIDENVISIKDDVA